MNKIIKYLLSVLAGTIIMVFTGCEKTDNGHETGSVTDVEGNVYATVKIGTQWWMSESLRVTKYNNGDQIETTDVYHSVEDEEEPKYHWSYLGNEGLAAIYGRLYTWYVATDSRGICPDGWHVPSDVEWSTLTNYLVTNGYGFGGEPTKISKSMASTKGWILHGIIGVPGNDQGSNNSSGFNALPGGIREPYGDYLYAGADCFMWSSTTSATFDYLALDRLVDFDQPIVPTQALNKKAGLSVRCVKD